MPLRLFRFVPACLALLAAAGHVPPAAAQIPDKFTNLEVLPKDIGHDELVGIMRSFSGALGVRCGYCHAVRADSDPPKLDFPSDGKKEKKIARTMMGMVGEINGTLLPKAGIENPVRVQCATCHHGVPVPEQLADITKREFEKGGIEGARSKYLELKEQYYGSAAYDFTPGTLLEVAEWLAGARNDADAAIAILRFDIEQHPDAGSPYSLLGHIQADRGETEAAIASLEKAVELDPEDRHAARLLQELRGGE